MAALLAAGLALLTGCATSMDAQVKAEIRTVSLEPLQLADKPVVATPGTGMVALLTGGLGLGLHLNATDAPTAFKEIVARQVDVPAEIRRAARTELERKGYRVVDAGQPADARLVIKGNWALGLASLTGDERGAGTTLNAELNRSSDGRNLYRRSALGLNADPAQKSKIRLAPFEQWFKDEALIAEQYRLVPAMVAAEVLQGL
jgi:hypothetical protein